MSMRQTAKLIEITSRGEGQRIDNFLFTCLKGVPKSLIYRILRTGQVRVDKKRVKPNQRLELGQILRIPPLVIPNSLPPAIASMNQQTILKQAILFEDSHFLILNKPTGIAVHGGSGISLGVIETLRQMYPKHAYLELAHRLDKETSGCLIIAKKPSALRAIHTLLRQGEVSKIYTCLVKGHWDQRVKNVDVPLLKQQLASGERLVKVAQQGKPANTGFKVIQRFAEATLLEVTLHSGRMHQIRVHTAYVKHPIAADDKYGDKVFNKTMRAKCKRLFLHASQIQFTCPLNQQKINVTAPLPKELRDCLDQLS